MSEPSSYGVWPGDWKHLPAVTDKQRFVLELRYGFKDGIEWSHEDIAGCMGISKQAVEQIESRALETIRKGLRVGG